MPPKNKVNMVSFADAVLHTSTGSFPLRINVARTFFSRLCGLMLKLPLQPNDGLLLTRCPSVHTAFMRYPIDIVYLDRAGRVLRCVAGLKPWRVTFSNTGKDGCGKRNVPAAHTLELAADTVSRLNIQPGDRLQCALWESDDGNTASANPVRPGVCSESAGREAIDATERIHLTNQRGATMIEFAVVGPVITLLGLAVLQYGMLFFAKNQINHASFMAARAGAMGNADPGLVQTAYAKALVPLYGGGSSLAELEETFLKVKADIEVNADVVLLNPTRESFDDWNDPALQDALGESRRVIPNGGLAFKNPDSIGATSGQSIHDANLIKLRITHGYEPKVPFMKHLYTRYLQWMDTASDLAYTRMVAQGRIPVVTHVTLQMQSNAIETNGLLSSPGSGNNGTPSDPGDPPSTDTPPPDCLTAGCTVDVMPVTPNQPGGDDTDGGGADDGGGCAGGDCPACGAA